jgi:putative inorganic carbon (hco3(-)) transporter
MITDLLILVCLAVFAMVNVIAPLGFVLGYVWIDTFYPQFVSYNIFGAVPISLIFGILMLLVYVLNDRKATPKTVGLLTLYGLLACCITLSTIVAVAPDAAFVRYNASIKVLLAAAFMPFVINTRIRIEAFMMVILFAATAHILPWGVKTALSGGGYQKSLGLLGSNGVPLAESSTMAAFVFACIPLFIHLAKHNKILDLSLRWRRILFWGLSAEFAIGAFGSFARTGVVAMACMLGGYFLRSKRKLVFLPIFAVLAGGFLFASDSWKDRMETITDYRNESSAATRVVIWQWAWNFAQQHPFGGGGDAYLVQDIATSQIGPDGQPVHVVRRAFHSIYFSILAEHGYLGILTFLSIVVGTLRALQKTRNETARRADLEWLHDLAGHLQIGLVALLAGASFIDASFYPILWYPLALGLCVRSVALQALSEAAPVQADPAAVPVPIV